MRSRPFVVLYASVLVATMGISMVSPLLPVYAEELGATGIWMGLTFSIFAVSQAIVSPFAGGWSDRYGRKPFILAGLALYLVSALGYLGADSFIQVLAFRALSGFGTSFIFSVARAYIGDIVPEGREGTWFGVFATGDVIGFGIGPIFAGSIRQVYGFDSVFVGMALLMGAALVIVAVLLPRRVPSARTARADAAPAQGVLHALRDPLVFALTLNMALIAMTFGSTFSFLGVRLELLGVAPFLVGVAFSMESFASGFAQPALGYLADRRSRRAVVTFGLMVAAAMLLLLGVVTTLPLVFALLFGMGIGSSASMVGASAMQVTVGRRVGMGTVIGLGAAGNAVGVVFGSVIGGFFVSLFDEPAAAFYFGGATMLAGVPLFLWLTRGYRGETRATAIAVPVTAPD
ncbi:MAG: MFS transporter [Chloroflexi bacterium]|nr:MFS transporter [Chloroflexota bacterium]